MTTTNVSKTLDSRCIYGEALAAHAPPAPNRPSSTQQPSWFSGLRSRIAQISMPEWLSQLGIGTSQHADNRVGPSELSASCTQKAKSSVLAPVSEDISGVEYVNESYIFPTKYSSHTLDSFLDRSSITLDQNALESENFDWGWTLDSALWNGDQSCYDTLVMQHFGPLKNLVTLCQQPGKGHNFQSMSAAHPTWCDKCGDFMWGFLTHAVKCESCNYTCHAKCKSLVTLDCKTVENSIKSVTEEQTMSSIYPSIQKVVEANGEEVKTVTNALQMQSQETEDGDNFSGFVQIHMNFTRPINVVVGETPPSFFDIFNSSGTTSSKGMRTITTFFLPRNTVKNVNIGSQMTTREMIVILLRKFKVADNPRKFALYERICEQPEGENSSACQLKRIPDDAFPLQIARAWQQSGENKQLVLQENDTGDILWDMFEIPELENFLRILEDEEKQYSLRIRQKYNAYRFYLDEQLRSRGYFSENDGCEDTGVVPSAPVFLDHNSEEIGAVGVQ